MGAPLIDVSDLKLLLNCGDPASILDIRWQLGGPPGRADFERGHLPGAVFVDMETDLADPPGAGGRHPLPEAERFGAAMRRAGVRADRPVVVYDAATSMSASRAWWLLRYFGHPSVRVLDGGLAAWTAAGARVTTEVGEVVAGDFVPVLGGMPILDATAAARLATTGILLDARAAERYRGDVEPVDPVAGHIPGAVSAPTSENVDADGRFVAAPELTARFEALGAGAGHALGSYCGSGVTAAHEVLALELAGFRAALYPGSWSEWITDPSRPVAVGSQR